MIQQRYAAGDDIEIPADALFNGADLNIVASGSVLKAGLFRPGTTTRAGSTTDVVCTKPGTPTNRVVATFPRATTADIAPGIYEAEFQLEEAGKVRTAERFTVWIGPNGVQS